MAKSYEVLSFLRPNGGYIQVGTDYECITFEPNCEPFTKEEYNSIVEQWNSEYSFAGIANAVSIVSNITAQYKKDYKYLMDKLESLKQENQQLKTQIQSMSQDLVKAHQHTWM